MRSAASGSVAGGLCLGMGAARGGVGSVALAVNIDSRRSEIGLEIGQALPFAATRSSASSAVPGPPASTHKRHEVKLAVSSAPTGSSPAP